MYLPDFFEPLLTDQYGARDAARIVAGCRVRRHTTLRANTLLTDRAHVAAELEAAGLESQPVAWYDDAFVLAPDSESALWSLDLYQAGYVYLQSLSSMIPALILNAQAGDDVCDLCAAPGGKTTQIAALTQGAAYLTACEMHAPRAEKLRYNLEKLGARSVSVMCTDARRLDEFFSFDRILVDAPCSGSGTLDAANPKTMRRFTPKLIQKSVKAQRALLSKGLALLKPGGTLVYSTCSVLKQENEEVVSWALDQANRGGHYDIEPCVLNGADDLPRLPTAYPEALCLYPTDRYEGFFVAKITRKR